MIDALVEVLTGFFALMVVAGAVLGLGAVLHTHDILPTPERPARPARSPRRRGSTSCRRVGVFRDGEKEGWFE